MIAMLLDRPVSQAGFDVWSFHNADHHTRLIDNLAVQRNTVLNRNVLWPINTRDIESWLNKHSQSHDDINNALNLPGQDLSRFREDDENEMRAWLWNHFKEHVAWQAATGVS